MSFWLVVKKVIREADVVLFVLDARMPVLSMNREIKEKIERQNKKMFLIFNKIDLISERQLDSLKKDNKNAFFVSGAKNIGIKNTRNKLLAFAKENGIETLRIGVVGYPNVGKSSIINAISKKARAPVSSIAGTTKGIQWIKSNSLKF